MILTRVVCGLAVGAAMVLESAGAVAAEAEAADTNPLAFKTDLALWTAVIFVVLLLVLWKFAWGPIADGLRRREQGIADQISEAEESNRQAKELLAQYEQKLVDSKDEVRKLLEKGRHDAEQVSRELIDQARQETLAEQQRSLRQIDAATANAMKELAGYSADLAVELAGKIVRAELKPKDHAELIQQAMANFVRQPPSQN
jgi:F-type H+-transporting ATPase subunit b